MNKVTFYAGNYTLHGNFRPLAAPPRVDKPKRKRTTSHQRETLKALFAGAFIIKDGAKYAVRDQHGKRLHRLSVGGLLEIQRYLFKHPDGRYFLSRSAVINARPNTWVKQYYLTVKDKV